MASIIRSIVASPRLRHVETGLDLCYVSETKPCLIAMSMPTSTFPTTLYRNPLDQVIAFLNTKHGLNWHIWELRAEGSGYKDEEFEGRVFHAPWPDHHPPPFSLIPKVLGSMKGWLDDGVGATAVKENDKVIQNGNSRDKSTKNNTDRGGEREGNGERVIVVHCKAGKGRSGTILTSYLISEHNYTAEDAMALYTMKRMRPVFGAEGVSIPSQRRYVRYVERWTNELGKLYIERKVRVTEIKLWGLRDGVKITLAGYVEGGKKRKDYWKWRKGSKPSSEQASHTESTDPADPTQKIITFKPIKHHHHHHKKLPITNSPSSSVLPGEPIYLETSDINISFERHTAPPLLPSSTNLTLITSIAHVWFNAYFESINSTKENDKKHSNPNSFTINWEAMDGVKGTSTKGTKAFDKMCVIWEFADDTNESDTSQPPIIVREGDGIRELVSRSTEGGTEIMGNKEEEEPTLGLRTKSSIEEGDGEESCNSSVSSVEGVIADRDEGRKSGKGGSGNGKGKEKEGEKTENKEKAT